MKAFENIPLPSPEKKVYLYPKENGAAWGGRDLGRMRINKITLLLLIIFLTGCVFSENRADAGESGEESEVQIVQESNVSEEEENGISSAETEPNLADETAESVPDICVNQLGYITQSDKVAIFYGEELPQEFHVVKEESGEVVFAGYLKDKGYNTKRQEYNGYGDFSEVQEGGTYYIEAPPLGRSYPFMIGDDLYGDVFKEFCKRYEKFKDSIESSTESGEEEAEEIAVILLAYELNAGVFTDDVGISESGNEIPDLLDEIRYKIEWMLDRQDTETPEAFAMALAKFSYLYQEYDADFATDCLRAADGIWLNADSAREENTDGSEEREWKFAAAAELYRASGKQSYHNYVVEFLSEEDSCEKMDLPAFIGYVTYISTRQTVDIALCEEITRALTVRAEEAAKKVNGILFGEQSYGTDESCQELLDESKYLILINHMITSKEYALMVEDCFHYLMGRNPQSVSCIDRAGNSGMILLLSDILNWQWKYGSGVAEE